MNSAVRKLAVGSVVGIAQFSHAVVAFAAESEGEHHQHHGSIADLQWPWINLILYVAIMFVLLRKPLVNAWHKRVARIEELSAAGARELQAAQERLAAAQAKAAAFDAEAAMVRSSIEADTKLEAQKIHSDAEARVAAIRAQGAASGQGEERAAQERLRKLLAAKVLEMASSQVKAKMTDQKDAELRTKALTSVRSLVQ